MELAGSDRESRTQSKATVSYSESRSQRGNLLSIKLRGSRVAIAPNPEGSLASSVKQHSHSTKTGASLSRSTPDDTRISRLCSREEQPERSEGSATKNTGQSTPNVKLFSRKFRGSRIAAVAPSLVASSTDNRKTGNSHDLGARREYQEQNQPSNSRLTPPEEDIAGVVSQVVRHSAEISALTEDTTFALARPIDESEEEDASCPIAVAVGITEDDGNNAPESKQTSQSITPFFQRMIYALYMLIAVVFVG